MKRFISVVTVLTVLILWGTCQGASPFYKGKTVRIIVGTSPGGGYDTYARLIARHLAKHIPGDPTVIVDNMAGAGGLLCANQMYKVVKPDGLTIGHFNGGIFLNQAVAPTKQGIEFDARRFVYLGAALREAAVCAFTKQSGITSVGKWQASKAPVKIAGYGPGAFSPDMVVNILKEALGLPINLVTGYKGTSEMRLAAESGEVAGTAYGWDSMKVAWKKALEVGDVVVVLQAVPKPFSDLPNVPLAISLAKTDEARRLIDIGLHKNSTFVRPFVLPPGTPKERTEILRKAFSETLSDSEFLAEADKSKLTIDPVSADELEKAVLVLFGIDPALRAKLGDILFK